MSKIESEGLRLGQSVVLSRALAPVRNVSCVQQSQGLWLLSWNGVYGAQSYEAQTTATPDRPNGWAYAGNVPECRWQFRPIAETDVWIRLRAVGVTGAGPWSDPLLMRVRGEAGRMAA